MAKEKRENLPSALLAVTVVVAIREAAGKEDFQASSGGGGSGWVFTESSFSRCRSGDSSRASQFRLSSSFYLTDIATFAGDKVFPRPDGKGTEQGHRSSGYAKICRMKLIKWSP